MKRFILATIFGSAMLFLALAPQVRADGTDNFTYTGIDRYGNGVTASWSLPSSPTPDGGVNAWYFSFLNDVTVTYTIGNTTKTDSNTTLYFINNTAQNFYGGGYGGFELVENAGPWTVLVAEYFTNPGVALFSGSTTQPTFNLGTYNLTNMTNGVPTPGTLVISTPEPSVLLLLLTGLLASAVVLGLKRVAA